MALSGDVWRAVDGGVGEEVVRRLGDLRLRLRREEHELWVQAAHAPGEPGPGDWTRWAIAQADSLELRAGLPDRPVVVSTEQPFFLPPQGRARVFVRIPIVARLTRIGRGGKGLVLEAFPSLVLSDTWWGSFMDGELAYWVTTKARRAVYDALHEGHLAVCPFVLVNGSNESLPVDRFAVRVSHLTLFGRGRAFWTDEVHVRYQGLDEGSEIRYAGRVPEEAAAVDKVADPTSAPPKGLHARTFGRLRALSGWS